MKNNYHARCMECSYIQLAESLEEARRLATLHTRLTPHLYCFGYDKE
jgi:hypothetical protein